MRSKSYSLRLARLSPAVAVAVMLLAFSTIAAGAQEALVPASNTTKQDSQGYRWDFQPGGTIGDGSDDCFDNGMALEINGSQGNSQRVMMTADGAEYAFDVRYSNGITVKRRVRVDTQRAVARYLETVENNGSQPQQVRLTIHSMLGNNCQALAGSSGTPYAGSLGKDEVGFAAIQQPGGRPSVLWLLADRRSKQKPVISIQGNRDFRVTYTLEVKPKSPVSVLHYVAQRRNATIANVAQSFTDFYKKGRLVDAQLVAAIRKQTVNFGGGGAVTAAVEEEAPVKGSLQPLATLLETLDVSRGKADLLVFGEAGKISGTVTGDDLQVQTAYGPVTVGLANIAAIDGGGGQQNAVRIFLRSGEILSGQVKADNLLLSTDAGLKVNIEPQKVGLLVMRTSPADGVEPPDSAGLLQTDAGDCLALASGQNSTVEASTPWGNFLAPFDQITRIVRVREPYPSQRITLASQTQLFGLLRGTELALNSLRFGPVKIAPRTIREFRRKVVAAKPVAPTGDDAGDGDDEDDVAPGMKNEAFCRLVGENVLAGTLDAPEIHFNTGTGATVLDPKTLRSVQRSENAKEGELAFTVKMGSGDEVTGQIEERVLPILSGGKVWRVPTIHLVSISNPPPAPAPTPEAAPAPASAPAATVETSAPAVPAPAPTAATPKP